MHGRTRSQITLRMADDLEPIFRARHQVYAEELGQYEPRPDGVLADAPGVESVYITAEAGGRLLGFVGVTPPGSPRLSLDRYVRREDVAASIDDKTYEIRALTVMERSRGSRAALALMHAAHRHIQSRGGTRVVAMGRREVLGLYERVGMRPVGCSFQTGAVAYEVLTATVDELASRAASMSGTLGRLEQSIDWRMDVPFRAALPCYHGGAFFEAIGPRFDDLDRRHCVINADVLDAWFPPAPAVLDALRDHMDWIARTSPPTHCEGLMQAVAEARGIEPACVLPGAGSSALIFLALRDWLSTSSRVLLLEPTYGEYAHVLERLIGCRVDRLCLARDYAYALDPDELATALATGYDLFVWVNPNNPTGQHVPIAEVQSVLRRTPRRTCVWIDEAYVDYPGPGQSLERWACASKNVVVCKSLSKACALSGLRVAYLAGPIHLVEGLRSLTPPWAVSLPAQIAAVRALASPDYYAARYAETRALREGLVDDLARMGAGEIIPGAANWILFRPPVLGPSPAAILQTCRREGLFLRSIPPYGDRPETLRIAVKDAATNTAMVEILAHALRAG